MVYSIAPGICADNSPNPTSLRPAVRDRCHSDAHLVLWCLEGSGRVDSERTTTNLQAGEAVLIPSGQRHSVLTSNDALIYPVFLTADRVQTEGSGIGEPFTVGAALADALLLLTISSTTMLSPSEERVDRLAEVVVGVAGARLRERPPAEIPRLPVPFIPWVTNQGMNVVIWCVRGNATLVVSGETTQKIYLREDHAAVVPPGVPHQVLGSAGNVTLPAFLPDEQAPQELTLVRVDRTLRRALHMQNLADTTLLQPGDWNPTVLARSLERSCSATLAAQNGKFSARADRVRTVKLHLLEHPTDLTDVETWARRLGITARSLERDFAAETGEGLRDWRSRLRMEWAADQLLKGYRPGRLARDLGFARPGGLTRAFLRHHGVTPSTFHREARPA